MGRRDEKLISKIESKPFRHDIQFNELEKYYNLHGYFAEKQDGTSHVQFKNSANGIRVTVKKENPVKVSYVAQAVKIVKQEA